MSGTNEDDTNIVDTTNIFWEKLKPSKEDLARKFTNEELTKLCLKRKCRVEMWKWNLVYEYRLIFEEEGRYQRWDDKKRQKMLKKAVNIAKSTIGYSDEEIEQTRKKEWEWGKKDSILSLNLWEHDEKRQKEKKRQVQVDETAFNNNEDEQETILPSICQTDVESEEESEINFTDVHSDVDFEIPSNTPENLLSMDNTMDHLKNVFNINTESLTLSLESLTAAESEQLNHSEQETILASISQSDIDIETEIYVNNETSMNKPEESALNFFEVSSDVDIKIPINTQEKLSSIENNSNHLKELFDINTESLTINTESLIADESEQLNHSLQVLSLVYNNFENEISITSTENLEFKN